MGAWLLLSVPGGHAAPQPAPARGFSVEVWENNRGLPQSSVLTLTLSREGYLWLSTLNGLARFDGSRFTVFEEGDTPGLGRSPVVHLFEDSRARLWMGTESEGIKVLENGRILSPPSLSLGGQDRTLDAAAEAPPGVVWFHNANGEIWRLAEEGAVPFLLSPNLPSSHHFLIHEPGGSLWVGTDQRQVAVDPDVAPGELTLPVVAEVPVARLDYLLPKAGGGYWRLANGLVQQWEGTRLKRHVASYPWGPYIHVSAACEDASGNLVVGTLGAGLYWFEPDGQATALSLTNGLSNNYILSLACDRSGTLWVGTDGGGLNRIRRHSFGVLEPTRGMVVQSVAEDDQGGLWIGANSGGVNYWRNGSLTRHLPTLSIRAVLVNRHQQVWVGTRTNGLYRLDNGQFDKPPGSSAVPQEVQALFEDRAGRLWVGTRDGLASLENGVWSTFTTSQGLSSDNVLALVEDAEGALWIGTDGGGLNRLAHGTFTVIRQEENGLPSDTVTALCMDREGTLWIGTRGGIARWNQGSWTTFTKRQGLASNFISFLTPDAEGHLWVGSSAGLMRLSLAAMATFAEDATGFVPGRVFGRAEGLPSEECAAGSQPAACLSREGTLWIPTTKGLASVRPGDLPLNTHTPPVVIGDVLIEGESQNRNPLLGRAPEKVVLPVGRHRLEIHFTSLNLGAPEQARFKYRLTPHEQDWIDAGSIRLARYSQLPPGDYRFEVTACNEDGVWNEQGSSVAVIVLPPFWRTWWFMTGSSALSLVVIVLVVHRLSTMKLQRQVAELRQQEALESERARIARDIHDQVGASLTQVALLGELVESDKDLPAEVEAHARQISQTARDTTRSLDEIVWTVNPSNDTLEGLVTYICKHAQDFFGMAGLRYRLDVPSPLPDISLPPEVRHHIYLAAKEAITNVVRHAHAQHAWLRLRVEPGQFILELADDGRGPAGMDKERAATRNGLRNMRRRMEDIGGAFLMDQAPEGGMLVRFTVPIKPR